MKTSKQELLELNACQDVLARFIKQVGDTDSEVEVASLIGGENTYSDLLWLAGKKLQQEKIVKFACDCALINIELIKQFTSEYDLIVEFLNNPAAYAAAYAATRAATVTATADASAAAAYAAADAAATTARAATYAYAYSADYAAAYATADAAADAATDAAYAAADAADTSKEKVTELLINLFSEETFNKNK